MFTTLFLSILAGFALVAFLVLQRKNSDVASRLLIVLAIVLAAFHLGGCAHSEPWTRDDTLMFSAYMMTSAADTYTTSKFDDCYPLAEANPIVRESLGANPESDDLWRSQLLVWGANYFIARAMPEKWRHRYLGIWTVAHLGAAMHNQNEINDAVCW